MRINGLIDYAVLGGFLVLGAILASIAVAIPKLISPRALGRMAGETYECGIETVGSAWVRFGVAYYLFALIFVAFEVDVLYLFPVAVVYGTYAWRDLVEVVIFIGVLVLALLYARRRGVFRWK